jgi:pimeloyl-ACP methyl ester carboxylesterase
MERWLQVVALTLVAFTIFAAETNAAPLDLKAANCAQVATLAPEQRARVRCGWLQVPENYAKPRGRQIQIAVAIVEPKSNKPTDPLVMLHGGPGGGDVDAYRYRLEEPLGARTLILFDQRGVQHSKPTLCPELGDAIFTASVRGLSPDAETADLVLAHKRCHDRLIADGVDLAKYNTDATVADMEALRIALGLERWKVYGISYGTAVGLAYLRDHADRIEALILDSVYALDSPPASNVVINMMQSLTNLSQACAANSACRDRFGDVEASFQEALAGLIREPLVVPSLDATADWTDAVRIGPSGFLAVIHQLLYDRDAYPLIPYVIDRVAARDGEVFALLVDQFHGRANAITHGQYAAVECYERFPFDSRDAYEQASAKWPPVRDHMTLIVRHFDICGNWSAKARAPMQMPGRATMPTLVLGASWDPITPAATSRRVAEELGAHYAELPFHGHGVRSDKTCGAPMIRAFLDQPDKAPDTACTRTKTPPAFATSIIRAPAVAREIAALAAHGNPAAAPTGVTLAGTLAFMIVSTLIWCFVGLTRTLRYGTAAWAGFWRRPGVPLGLAALTLSAALATFVWSFGTAASGSPLLLMIGLPASSLAPFIWPWAGVALLVWGAVTLLFGDEKADRPAAYAVHLWLVLVAGCGAALLFASLGLLIPDLI